MNKSNMLAYTFAGFLLIFLLPLPQFIMLLSPTQPEISLFGGTLIRLILFALIIRIATRHLHKKLIQWKQFTHKPYRAIILGCIAGGLCFFAQIYLFAPPENPTIHNHLLLFSSTLVLAALLEELVFRGISATIFAYYGYTALSTAFLSSLLFALLHSANSFPQSIFAFFAGLLFFGINAYSKNLLSSLTAHVFYNIVLLVRYTL